MANQDMIVAPKPLAYEIAAYTEEELDQYLEENGRIVSVQDPENISPEFIQRLRDITQREHGAAKSCAVDLDQVAARLQVMPVDREQFNRSPSLATTASLPPQEELDLEDLQKEKQYYQELVNAGGRSPYPFHLLEEFFWRPEQFLEHKQYHDVVFFWRSQVYDKDDRTCFCGCHLSNWKCFQHLQRIIRDQNVKDEWTLIDAASWDSWEAYVDRFGPKEGQKEGQWGFWEYAESVSRRLKKYGFTRPFQLDRDLYRQDKLTTWIEYLGYEYWFYDRAASYVKSFQQRHDVAWSKLVKSNVLGPDESYEAICNIETAFRRANERERAEEDVHTAAAALSSTERAVSKSSFPGLALRKRLLTNQSALSMVKERYETIKVRNNAITAFLQKIRRYRCEKDEANRYNCLLWWIEKQIPSIELEMGCVNSTEDDPDQTESIRGLKRGRMAEHGEAQSRKRRRVRGNTQPLSAGRASLISPPPSHEIPKCRKSSSIDDGRASKRVKSRGQSGFSDCLQSGALGLARPALVPDTRATQESDGGKASSNETIKARKPLRRSARIAEKRGGTAKIAPVPVPLSPMAPKQSLVEYKATRAKRSRPRQDGLPPAANPQGIVKRGRSTSKPRSTNIGAADEVAQSLSGVERLAAAGRWALYDEKYATWKAPLPVPPALVSVTQKSLLVLQQMDEHGELERKIEPVSQEGH